MAEFFLLILQGNDRDHDHTKGMITYYCPACWHDISATDTRCPACGFELSQDRSLDFEAKLLRSLEHPVPEKRMLAIRILGELGSQAALPGLQKMLETEVKDIYALREALVAVSKIRDPRSRDILLKATRHPYPLIRRLAGSLLKEGPLSKKTCLLLIRHGQTEWNRVERFRGRADVPLNEAGLAQAAATGRRVAMEWMPTAVYSSPLTRAIQTAEAIAQHFDLRVLPHPGLIDIDYGEWQGLTPEEARQRWPEEVDNWYNHPQQAQIPGGETLADLRTRAMQTVSELTAQHSGETIVLVGHTVINRIILLGMMELGNERFWQIKQEPCAINIIEAEKGDFVLVTLNDTCHIHDQ
jgi:probable phosphoglycerate mutase